MSKKKHANKINKSTVASQTKKPVPVQQSSGIKSMTNWLLLLVAILPFLFSRVTIDTNIAVRYLFLACFIFLFLIIFYLPRLIKGRLVFNTSIQIKILFGLGIGFALWSILGMAFAINPAEGYYEISRYILNLIVLFIVLTVVIEEEGQVLKLCKLVTIVAMAQSLVGLMQNYDLAFTDLPGNVVPYGLMGNRNVFGSAEALLLPFAIYVLYKASTEWKIICGITMSMVIFSLILSQTRSAWLAGVSIPITSLILVMIFSKANRKKWIIATSAGIIGTAVLLVILFKSDEEGTLSKSVKERAMSLLKKDTTKSSVGAGSTSDRMDVWKKTILLIKDKPVFGVGTSNWKIAIPAYGTEGLRWSDGFIVPDRPHNVYLLLASENGIVGALLYFGVWILVAIIGLKAIIQSKTEDRRILCILMLAGLVAFAIDSMFSFPTERIEHSLYMMLMGGILLGSYINNKVSDNNVSISKLTIGMPLFVIAGCIVLFNIFLGYKKYNFEVHANRAHAYDRINSYQEEIFEVEEGRNSFITLDPNGTPIELFSGIAYKALKNYDQAISELNKAKRYHPNSARVYNNLGTVYTDMKDYKKAIENYKMALKFAPAFETVYKNLSVNYFLVEDYAGCIEALSHVNVQSDPNLVALFEEAKRLQALKK